MPLESCFDPVQQLSIDNVPPEPQVPLLVGRIAVLFFLWSLRIARSHRSRPVIVAKTPTPLGHGVLRSASGCGSQKTPRIGLCDLRRRTRLFDCCHVLAGWSLSHADSPPRSDLHPEESCGTFVGLQPSLRIARAVVSPCGVSSTASLDCV